MRISEHKSRNCCGTIRNNQVFAVRYVFQDKFDKNGEEMLAAHYLRYVNLAANLHPPLSEYDLLGALIAHYPYEMQKCMISANLKSNQEALTLLGKLQAMDEERKAHKENSLEKNKEIFERGKTNRQEITGRTIGVSTIKL